MVTKINPQQPLHRRSSFTCHGGGRRRTTIHRLLWTTVLLSIISFSWLQIRMSILLGSSLENTIIDNEATLIPQYTEPDLILMTWNSREDKHTTTSAESETATIAINTLKRTISSSSSQTNLDTTTPNIPTQPRASSNSIRATTPMEQLEHFLTNHPDTSGARFIHLLRMYLHYQPGMENRRMDACDTVRFPHHLIHCLTGRPEAAGDSNDMDESIAKKMFMPLNSNITVYEMPRYPETDHIIPSLGTIKSCLPLFLAGSVVGTDKLTLELGPFFGLSSKCIVAGMQTKGVRANSFIALDTFQGIQNYMVIKNSQQHSWILQDYPTFNWHNSSFLFLWEKAVQPIYPTAQGRAGYITASTLNPKTIGKPTQDIELISVDSAKSVEAMQNQLGGLGPIKTGTILFLLDFEYVSSQIQLVYGCLREAGYLLPVYTAWRGGENWAFVVTRDFSFSDFNYPTCVTIESEQQKYWIEQDVLFLASLQQDTNGPGAIHHRRIEELTQKLYSVLEQPFKG